MSTKKEFESAIIEKAFALKKSIVVNDYHLPKEMITYINQICDTVGEYTSKFPSAIKQYLKESDINYIKKCREERDEYVRNLVSRNT